MPKGSEKALFLLQGTRRKIVLPKIASLVKNPLRISLNVFLLSIPAGIYLLKVNNRNTRTRCEICSKLTIKTPERRH